MSDTTNHFQAEFGKATAALEMTDLEIADYLHVSRSTVVRWRAGQNLPFDAVQDSIIKCLRSRSNAS